MCYHLLITTVKVKTLPCLCVVNKHPTLRMTPVNVKFSLLITQNQPQTAECWKMWSGCIKGNVGPSILGACFVREIVTLFSSVMACIAFLKGTYYAFSFVKYWKWKRSKSAPTEAPVSHRKHCSWNTSSVVPHLILWLCDITGSDIWVIYAKQLVWHVRIYYAELCYYC